MTRVRLPNRRRCEIIDTEFRGRSYAVVTGRASGAVAEVFVEPAKVSTDGSEDARDVGILISIALQCGVPLDTLRTAVSRVEQGRPSTLSGHVLDLIAEVS